MPPGGQSNSRLSSAVLPLLGPVHQVDGWRKVTQHRACCTQLEEVSIGSSGPIWAAIEARRRLSDAFK
jgi:hypothetical protein